MNKRIFGEFLATAISIGVIALFAGCGDGAGGDGNNNVINNDSQILFTGVTGADVITLSSGTGGLVENPYTGGAQTFGYYETDSDDPDEHNFVQADWPGYNVSINSSNKLTVQLGTPGNEKLTAFPYGVVPEGVSVSINPTSAKFLPIYEFRTTQDREGKWLGFNKVVDDHTSRVNTFVYCDTNATVTISYNGMTQATQYQQGWNYDSESGYKWTTSQ